MGAARRKRRDSATTQPSTASTTGSGRFGAPRSVASTERTAGPSCLPEPSSSITDGRLARGRDATEPSERPARDLAQAARSGRGA